MSANGTTARRFHGKPLRQPTYSMKDVPWASKELTGSSLSLVTERQHLVDSIAEITLLCNEATRRQKQNGTSTVAKKTTKPLSIEYIFDRIDTDDPILGFMVRTDQPMSFKGRPSTIKNAPNWKRGMLQGFITMTTFTNWQSSFRFDSLHEMAWAHDDKELEFQMDNGMRKVDEDGSLADELEATVKGGNPHVEGIVYPRIAELSLFGGLGCGKQLLSLLIEHLECMKGSESRNYDYILLQATENSIPFYESMGFIRVGCVQGTSPSPYDYTSGPVEEYHTQKNGETPTSIANLFGVDSGDVVFLNKPLYLTLMKNSWLKKGTKIFVPAPPKPQKSDAKSTSSKAQKFYVANENETLRGISKKLDINFSDLLHANKARFPDLTGTSRLMDGTRIQISRFDQIDVEEMIPYSHWTFPDAETDDNEPSYMMALRLNRRKGNEAKFKPVATSLAVPIQPFSPQATGAEELLQEPSTQVLAPVASARKPQPPSRPKRPPTSYAMFCSDYRAENPDQLDGLPVPDATRIISDKWKAMSKEEKAPYVERYDQSRAAHGVAMKIYNEKMQAFNRVSSSGSSGDAALLEKVVKLKPSSDEIRTPKFDYYYVLTYIPDLQWVHLIPLRKVGEFGQENPSSSGRPIWMIVGEGEGKEIDTTAARCEVVTAVTVRNSADADLEQWDIYDGEDAPFEVYPDLARSNVNTPRKPKKPLNSFSLFCIQARIQFKSELVGIPSTEATKLISAKWRAMSDKEKEKYKDLHNAEKAKYEKSLKKYEDELARFQLENPGRGPESSPAKASKSAKKSFDAKASREANASGKAKRGRGRPRKSDAASVPSKASSAKSKTTDVQPKSAKRGRLRKSDDGIVPQERPKQRSTSAVPHNHDGATPKKRKRGRPRKHPEQPIPSTPSVVSASPKAAIFEVESDPAAIERMLRRVKRGNPMRNSPRVRSRSEPPARQHSGPPPGDGDVILSLTDPYYKQIMYQHYKLLGTSRDLQREGRVCDEILGVFRKRIGRKGRYFKRPSPAYPPIQVDESAVLKKIKSDVVRRNESATAWDVNEKSTPAVTITSTPRKEEGAEEVKPKSQTKVRQTPVSRTKKQNKTDRSDAVEEKSLETGGRGDVVLSTLSSTYKSKLYATYRSMGTGKVGTEVEKDRGLELLSSLKRNLGRNGHFYKKSNQGNDLIQIDEEEALGKICRDINRRKDTWHLWRQQGKINESSKPSPKRSRPDNNGPTQDRARYPRRGEEPAVESKPKLAPIFLKCYKKKRPVVSDQGSDEEPPRKRPRNA